MSEPLKIAHVLRSPVGGLFRHVLDLATGQAAAGCEVCIVADASTGGPDAAARLELLRPRLRGGVHRLPMSRNPSVADLRVGRAVESIVASFGADIVHGHGAKGGLYARMPTLLPRATRRVRVYTPHGGSLHYPPRSLAGLLFTRVERALEKGTDLFLFESAFAAERFAAQICTPCGAVRVVHNGVRREEFAPVAPDPDAAAYLFIGELRWLKGVDTLIEALALLRDRGLDASAALVGAGPDEARFRTLVAERGLSDVVRFAGPMPARRAFALGRMLAAPSRAESLPYVVLEAAAAGMPFVATSVGGTAEILGSDAPTLVAPDDPEALAAALAAGPDHARRSRLRARVEDAFSVERMVAEVSSAYREALERARSA